MRKMDLLRVGVRNPIPLTLTLSQREREQHSKDLPSMGAGADALGLGIDRLVHLLSLLMIYEKRVRIGHGTAQQKFADR